MHVSPHKTWICPYCSHGANILVGRKKVNKYTNKHNKDGDKCYDMWTQKRFITCEPQEITYLPSKMDSP